MNDRRSVTRALDEIAKYIELSEPNPFRSRAFERAARAIEAAVEDVETLAREDRLHELSGVGKAIAAVVKEILATGRSAYLDELRGKYPPGIFDLLRVPGLGLRKIGILHGVLGISNLDGLETAARAGQIAQMKGFGNATQARILRGIETARRRTSLFLLPRGLEVAAALRERLDAIDGVIEVEITGGVRRRLEVLDAVDLVVATSSPAALAATILEAALLDPASLDGGHTIRGVARGDVEARLHLTEPRDFGAAVVLTTGAEAFVDAFRTDLAARGYELRGASLFRGARRITAHTESELFDRVGIPLVEPELRESGEVLKRKKRPRLVEPADLRGTFHIHSTYSDGRNSVLEMLTAARAQGFEYAGLSDHSQNAFYARGLTPDDLARQHAEIENHAATVAPMRVFRGTEADILNDGSIDYGPGVLSKLDFVIASIHSRFGMASDEMTERILTALDDPFVTFLGHLTGRRLLSREGYNFDLDRVFDRAAARGVMIEINGNPNRAELDWRLIRRAVDRGVVLSIHPDAHSIRELAHVISGTWIARKGGLTAKQIFNCRPVAAVAEHLDARRRKAIAATR